MGPFSQTIRWNVSPVPGTSMFVFGLKPFGIVRRKEAMRGVGITVAVDEVAFQLHVPEPVDINACARVACIVQFAAADVRDVIAAQIGRTHGFRQKRPNVQKFRVLRTEPVFEPVVAISPVQLRVPFAQLTDLSQINLHPGMNLSVTGMPIFAPPSVMRSFPGFYSSLKLLSL